MNRLRFALVAVALVVSAGCSKNNGATATAPTSATVTLQSIALSNNTSILKTRGDTSQTFATGTFSNGTTQDVTSTCANWASDSTSVLTINASGLVTVLASGSATITTTCQSVFARVLATIALSVATTTTVPPAASFTVSGTVTDGFSNNILKTATVQADGVNAGRSGATDGNGHYAISGLAAGSFQLTAIATGYQTMSRPVVLSGNTTLDFVLARVAPPTTTSVPRTTTTTTTIPSSRVRIGAICNDGTSSTSTGSGACSSHKGVRCWRYNDGSCTNP